MLGYLDILVSYWGRRGKGRWVLGYLELHIHSFYSHLGRRGKVGVGVGKWAKIMMLDPQGVSRELME